MISDPAYITLDIRDRTAIVTLNHPASLNALNAPMIGELATVFSRLETEDRVRAVILRGEGRAFAAGADIRSMQTMTPEEARAYSSFGNTVFTAIERFRLPVIAAVHGYALGGGLELMLSCDLSVSARGARFGMPEVTLGLVPGFGGCRRAARRIGIARAKELIYTGRLIEAEEAFAWGLVNRLADGEGVTDAAFEMAEMLCAVSPHALSSAKRMMNGYAEDEARGALEIDAFASIFRHPDARTGMAAFLAKAKPEWNTTQDIQS